MTKERQEGRKTENNEEVAKERKSDRQKCMKNNSKNNTLKKD